MYTYTVRIYNIYQSHFSRNNRFPRKFHRNPSSIGAISKGTPQLVAEALAIGIQNQATNTTQRLEVFDTYTVWNLHVAEKGRDLKTASYK